MRFDSRSLKICVAPVCWPIMRIPPITSITKYNAEDHCNMRRCLQSEGFNIRSRIVFLAVPLSHFDRNAAYTVFQLHPVSLRKLRLDRRLLSDVGGNSFGH